MLILINFHHRSYGEVLFMGVQNVSIAFMVQYFAGQVSQAFTFLFFTFVGLGVFMSPLTSMDLLTFLQGLNIVVVISSKVREMKGLFPNELSL